MATQRIGVYQEPRSSRIIQKAQLTYKLYLLEKARNKLEEELRDFTNQAYEDAHGVLNSSIPNPRYKDVIKALDRKCNEIVKLSALLKNYKADYQSFDRVSFNYFQPLKAALSHQQLKVSLDTLRPLSQQDGGKTSDLVNTPLTPSSSCLKQEKEKAVSEDKNKEVSMHIPAAIIQSNVVSEGKSEVLLPSVQDSFSEKSQCKLRSQVIWGHGDDVQVLHQKQTSSQLLRFLKEKAKTKGSLKVTFLEQTKSKYKANNSGSLLRTSPTVKTKSYQFRHVVTDDSVDERGPKTLHANVNHAPVFQVKRVHSCGPLIYSCVIATETELWDIGDIFTEVLLEESVHSTALDTEKWQQAFAQVEDSSISIELKPQTLQHMQPRLEKNDSNYSGRLAANIVNIPEFEIRKFEETEVVVSHVVSPSHFYIQHADSHRKLEALFTDLKVSHLYAEQNCIPDIGAQVIYWSPQNEQWFRAQVAGISGVSSNRTGKTSSINVQVNRLDYGDSSCVSLCNIKQLSSEMAVLPLQALQVSMAHVMPINGTDWTEEALGWFKAMVHDRTLYARTYPQGPTVTVELFLEKGKLGAMRRGASLSLRLAQNGHARHSKVKNSCLLKKSAIQLKMKEQEIEWEKYLISCYSQNKK
ncbi:uncharacterized protein LOC114138638 isoform X1 [Xiphophorus couchianus]|uniref:uncharacterized protein LOC114138638 isoform X1 n=1 Tax=Xiphophorus couchianus TaxID=32473 RepID=UPI001016BE7F|nr:uncharacterized protein LOC114138638 isoform X1 [Xiphophorus couchianus]XP_027863816.1 uncharacterized protein LOC114138638 isoform X1 [Xiphophorus couchianus]